MDADHEGTFNVNARALSLRVTSLARSDGGWPDHDEDGQDRPPTFHATAVALLSLSRCSHLSRPEFNKCKEGLQWLAQRGSQLPQMSIATLSMIVVAIEGLKPHFDGELLTSQPISALNNKAIQEIDDWMSKTDPKEMTSIEGTEYWRSSGVVESSTKSRFARQPDVGVNDATSSTDETIERLSDRFDVLFYLPHCLAAWACVNVDNLRRAYNGAICS